MCGRYYVDEETYTEIQKIVADVEQSLKNKKIAGDIHPTDIAPVIISTNHHDLFLTEKAWGYPGWKNKGVIFNARVETVMEKKMFQNGIRYHRAVIPARNFYEWNKQKEKNNFSRKDSMNLYMAGFYDHFGNEDRFIILTTQANSSMEKTHDRMPLILENSQIRQWLGNPESIDKILKQVPVQLERQADYEQQCLFPI